MSEEHRERHKRLHLALDELTADFCSNTNRPPSKATIMDLIEWSYQQTKLDAPAQGQQLLDDPIAVHQNEMPVTNESVTERFHKAYRDALVELLLSYKCARGTNERQ